MRTYLIVIVFFGLLLLACALVERVPDDNSSDIPDDVITKPPEPVNSARFAVIVSGRQTDEWLMDREASESYDISQFGQGSQVVEFRTLNPFNVVATRQGEAATILREGSASSPFTFSVSIHVKRPVPIWTIEGTGDGCAGGGGGGIYFEPNACGEIHEENALAEMNYDTYRSRLGILGIDNTGVVDWNMPQDCVYLGEYALRGHKSSPPVVGTVNPESFFDESQTHIVVTANDTKTHTQPPPERREETSAVEWTVTFCRLTSITFNDNRLISDVLQESPTFTELFEALRGKAGITRNELQTKDPNHLGLTGRPEEDPHNRQRIGMQFAWSRFTSVYQASSIFAHEYGHARVALERGFILAEAAPFLTQEQYQLLQWEAEFAAFEFQAKIMQEILNSDATFRPCVQALGFEFDPRLSAITAGNTQHARELIAEDYEAQSYDRWHNVDENERQKLQDVGQKVNELLQSEEWQAIKQVWSLEE